jgi:hypothetical protein
VVAVALVVVEREHLELVEALDLELLVKALVGSIGAAVWAAAVAAAQAAAAALALEMLVETDIVEFLHPLQERQSRALAAVAAAAFLVVEAVALVVVEMEAVLGELMEQQTLVAVAVADTTKVVALVALVLLLFATQFKER